MMNRKDKEIRDKDLKLKVQQREIERLTRGNRWLEAGIKFDKALIRFACALVWVGVLGTYGNQDAINAEMPRRRDDLNAAFEALQEAYRSLGTPPDEQLEPPSLDEHCEMLAAIDEAIDGDGGAAIRALDWEGKS